MLKKSVKTFMQNFFKWGKRELINKLFEKMLQYKNKSLVFSYQTFYLYAIMFIID